MGGMLGGSVMMMLDADIVMIIVVTMNMVMMMMMMMMVMLITPLFNNKWQMPWMCVGCLVCALVGGSVAMFN